MRIQYDLIQVGLGVMGLSAVEAATRRGLRTLGIEQFESPRHRFGSSHGPTRMIRQAYYEDPRYVPLVRDAYQAWRNLEYWSGKDLLQEGGGLVAGGIGSEVTAGARRAATIHGLPWWPVSSEELRGRYGIALKPNSQALYETHAGVIRAQQAMEVLQQKSVMQGAHLQFETRVLKISGGRGSFHVETSQGQEFTANHVILTPGSWLPQWSGVPIRVEREPVFWFETESPPNVPVFLYEEGSILLYGFPYLPRLGLKVGVHHTGQYTTADGVDRHIHASEIEEMVSYIHRIFPDYRWRLRHAEVCLYTTTPDANFLIGQAGSGIVVGGGFSGHGFKFAPVLGELLVDSALSGENPPDYDLFWPSRFQCPQGQ